MVAQTATPAQERQPSKPKPRLGTHWVTIVSLSALVLSLLIILLIHHSEPTIATMKGDTLTFPPKSIWVSIFDHLATGLFILGVWHSIDYLLIRKEFNEEITSKFDDTAGELLSGVRDLKRHFEMAEHDEKFGLILTHHDANHYDLSRAIKSSKNFVAVMADGHSWTSRHIEAFRERVKNPDKQTTFILVHPDSEQVNVISHKLGIRPDQYRDRIQLTVTSIRNLGNGANNVRFIGHHLICCHSLYMADGEITFSPYFLSTQHRSSPILVLRDAGEGSFFQKLESDIDALIHESSDITFPPTPPKT